VKNACIAMRRPGAPGFVAQSSASDIMSGITTQGAIPLRAPLRQGW
jgi:hypothetical protein